MRIEHYISLACVFYNIQNNLLFEIRLMESTLMQEKLQDSRHILLESSKEEAEDDNLKNQQSMLSGRQMSLTVGSRCANSTLNFSEFVEACLGIAVQKTTTLTATVTVTLTLKKDATIFVAGCTPIYFPYTECPDFFTTFPSPPKEPSTPQPGPQPYLN